MSNTYSIPLDFSPPVNSLPAMSDRVQSFSSGSTGSADLPKVDKSRPSDECVSDMEKCGATTKVDPHGPNWWWKYK